MSRDDYEERRRESNAYLDRRQNRIDTENTLAERSHAVSESIRKKDYTGAAHELGFVPSDSSGRHTDYSRTAETSEKPPSADEQFLEHSNRLITNLELSSFIPDDITQQWIQKIREIDIYQPTTGLLELDQLFASYFWAVEKYKPQRDIFDLAVNKTMRFDSEMRDIKHELNWLESILKHVARYLDKKRNADD